MLNSKRNCICAPIGSKLVWLKSMKFEHHMQTRHTMSSIPPENFFMERCKWKSPMNSKCKPDDNNIAINYR
jgi:hypothetical protein